MSKTRPCPRCSAQVPANSRFCQECGADVAAATPVKPARASSQWKIFAAGAVAIVVIVGATLTWLNSNKASEQPAAKTTAGPVTEIAAAGPLPTWLKTADPSIVADYAWAAEHYDELRYIPCYCGCNSVGHTGNASCYYRWDKDGKIQGYDAHALGWDVCVDITRDVRKGLAQGKTLTQIRSEVDKKYQSEGLKPTPTPMPPAGK